MSRRLRVATAGALGYALGSIPFGVAVGRIQGGVDVREHGSRSMGTTNVLRIVGIRAAGATFALDVAKGAVSVGCARALQAGPSGDVAAALGGVVGHSWPVLAGFRGGKSIATAFGSLLVMAPGAAAWAVIGGLTGLAGSRVVSVGSLAATGSAGARALLDIRRGQWAPIAFVGPAMAVIVYRHRANLTRLRAGTEPRLGGRLRGEPG